MLFKHEKKYLAMKNLKSTKSRSKEKSMKITVCVFLVLFISSNLSYPHVNYSVNTGTFIDLQNGKEYDEENDHQAIGQGKISFTAGFGFPELLNVGIRYQPEQVQTGLYLGSLPRKSDDEAIRSMSADVRFHFGGSSAL